MNDMSFNEELEKEYQLSEETKRTLNDFFVRCIGISYEQFDELDINEQQKILREYHKKNSLFQHKDTHVMIGSGEHSTFVKAKTGEKVMIGSGEHSCFIEAGLSLEESQRRLDDRLDDVMYSKPVAMVKKIIRRVRN